MNENNYIKETSIICKKIALKDDFSSSVSSYQVLRIKYLPPHYCSVSTSQFRHYYGLFPLPESDSDSDSDTDSCTMQEFPLVQVRTLIP